MNFSGPPARKVIRAPRRDAVLLVHHYQHDVGQGDQD